MIRVHEHTFRSVLMRLPKDWMAKRRFFQALEGAQRATRYRAGIFPRLGKSHENFSKPWKADL
jgi:hypothetical protein